MVLGAMVRFMVSVGVVDVRDENIDDCDIVGDDDFENVDGVLKNDHGDDYVDGYANDVVVVDDADADDDYCESREGMLLPLMTVMMIIMTLLKMKMKMMTMMTMMMMTIIILMILMMLLVRGR